MLCLLLITPNPLTKLLTHHHFAPSFVNAHPKYTNELLVALDEFLTSKQIKVTAAHFSHTNDPLLVVATKQTVPQQPSLNAFANPTFGLVDSDGHIGILDGDSQQLRFCVATHPSADFLHHLRTDIADISWNTLHASLIVQRSPATLFRKLNTIHVESVSSYRHQNTRKFLFCSCLSTPQTDSIAHSPFSSQLYSFLLFLHTQSNSSPINRSEIFVQLEATSQSFYFGVEKSLKTKQSETGSSVESSKPGSIADNLVSYSYQTKTPQLTVTTIQPLTPHRLSPMVATSAATAKSKLTVMTHPRKLAASPSPSSFIQSSTHLLPQAPLISRKGQSLGAFFTNYMQSSSGSFSLQTSAPIRAKPSFSSASPEFSIPSPLSDLTTTLSSVAFPCSSFTLSFHPSSFSLLYSLVTGNLVCSSRLPLALVLQSTSAITDHIISVTEHSERQLIKNVGQSTSIRQPVPSTDSRLSWRTKEDDFYQMKRGINLTTDQVKKMRAELKKDYEDQMNTSRDEWGFLDRIGDEPSNRVNAFFVIQTQPQTVNTPMSETLFSSHSIDLPTPAQSPFPSKSPFLSGTPLQSRAGSPQLGGFSSRSLTPQPAPQPAVTPFDPVSFSALFRTPTQSPGIGASQGTSEQIKTSASPPSTTFSTPHSHPLFTGQFSLLIPKLSLTLLRHMHQLISVSNPLFIKPPFSNQYSLLTYLASPTSLVSADAPHPLSFVVGNSTPYSLSLFLPSSHNYTPTSLALASFHHTPLLTLLVSIYALHSHIEINLEEDDTSTLQQVIGTLLEQSYKALNLLNSKLPSSSTVSVSAIYFDKLSRIKHCVDSHASTDNDVEVIITTLFAEKHPPHFQQISLSDTLLVSFWMRICIEQSISSVVSLLLLHSFFIFTFTEQERKQIIRQAYKFLKPSLDSTSSSLHASTEIQLLMYLLGELLVVGEWLNKPDTYEHDLVPLQPIPLTSSETADFCAPINITFTSSDDSMDSIRSKFISHICTVISSNSAGLGRRQDHQYRIPDDPNEKSSERMISLMLVVLLDIFTLIRSTRHDPYASPFDVAKFIPTLLPSLFDIHISTQTVASSKNIISSVQTLLTLISELFTKEFADFVVSHLNSLASGQSPPKHVVRDSLSLINVILHVLKLDFPNTAPHCHASRALIRVTLALRSTFLELFQSFPSQMPLSAILPLLDSVLQHLAVCLRVFTTVSKAAIHIWEETLKPEQTYTPKALTRSIIPELAQFEHLRQHVESVFLGSYATINTMDRVITVYDMDTLEEFAVCSVPNAISSLSIVFCPYTPLLIGFDPTTLTLASWTLSPSSHITPLHPSLVHWSGDAWTYVDPRTSFHMEPMVMVTDDFTIKYEWHSASFLFIHVTDNRFSTTNSYSFSFS
ncbi:hypothetical protein BLNAU_529 [Blattamonas nauphoetae]|uniref:Uncharacterized protein n=1 Tax=Blattamonas nauphoetae TaxID=2049346 RepID=A0ABQ9YLI7_9EUKA|nr:hypothetical protein BLNAU_529 [Blattamonas nauphoetae]